MGRNTVAQQHDFITDLRIISTNIHHELIHTDAPDLRISSAVKDYLRPIRHAAKIAVCVSTGNRDDASLGLSLPQRAIADGPARPGELAICPPRPPR